MNTQIDWCLWADVISCPLVYSVYLIHTITPLLLPLLSLSLSLSSPPVPPPSLSLRSSTRPVSDASAYAYNV